MDYETRIFNAASTRALQLSLSWAESTQCLVSIPISLGFIIILSSHLFLGLPEYYFLVGFKALLPSSMTYPSKSSRFNYPILGERYKLWSSSCWGLSPITISSLLCSNIRLSIPNSSLNIRDHVAQPYSTTDNIIVLYSLIFKFLREVKRTKCLECIITWISSL